MNGITIREAIDRLLTSRAINEGPDAQCTYHAHPDVGGAQSPPHKLSEMSKRFAKDTNTGFRISRTVKNWEILDADGHPILRSHPWDDSPNVARLGPGPALDVEGYHQLSTQLVSAANAAERLHEFPLAQYLWQVVVQVNERVDLPTTNARNESERLLEYMRAPNAI